MPSTRIEAGIRQAIELREVSFRYGYRANVLEQVTLRIPAGQTVAIVGESGTAKTPAFTKCLPKTVDLKVVETTPGMKTATVTNVLKPATLETGAVVKVPLFINSGETIRVDTRTGQYISRAK